MKTIHEICNEKSEALKQIKAQILDGSHSVTIPIRAFEAICSDYEKLKAENAYLQIQLSDLETKESDLTVIENLTEACQKKNDEITKLTKQNEIMKKALEFYANRDHYDIHEAWGKVCIISNDTETWKDFQIKVGGKRARQALKESEGVK